MDPVRRIQLRAEIEKDIESILRDHIKIIQEDSRRDTRTFRITGYRSAAQNIASMLIAEPEKK